MAKSAFGKFFFSEKKRKKEEKKKDPELEAWLKKWKEKNKEGQDEHNPFKKGAGSKEGPKEFGYSFDCKVEGQPIKSHEGAFRAHFDDMGGAIEKYYYWFQTQFTKRTESKYGFSTKKLYKLKDVFDASVSSAFHGQIGSKMGQIQQQVSTYLSQIGQLTKTILPMVREIRMMDERLEIYNGSLSDDPNDDIARQNEVALKSTWIEVVEQGIQNPNSVYSMATKLGFTTLPDFFFSISPHGEKPEEQKKRLHRHLEAMRKQHTFNKKLRDALEKKLVQYYTWKEKTWIEMQHTRKFRIKNLKQHYNVIRLYTSWLKPYLTMLKGLSLANQIDNPALVSAFETSNIELELLSVLESKKTRTTTWNSCLMIRIKYVTRPELTYIHQTGQRQPTHYGQANISIEPYVASDEDIEWYRKFSDKEILRTVSGTEIDFTENVEDILTSYGKDVEEYLEEAETGKRKEEEEEEKKRKKTEGFFDSFRDVFEGFKIFVPEISLKGEKYEFSLSEENRRARKEMEDKTNTLS